MKPEKNTLLDSDGGLVLVPDKVLLDAAVAEPEVAAPPTPPTDIAQPDGEAPGSPQPVPEEQPPEAPPRSARPEGVPADEWERRQIAVKDLAREFEPAGEGDVREFLNGRMNRQPTDEEVKTFESDVMLRRADDLADVLDSQMRKTSDQLKRSRRTVRVVAPRGFLKKAFTGLPDSGYAHIISQLISRGHNSDSINKKVVSRVTDEARRERLAGLLPDDGSIQEETD